MGSFSLWKLYVLLWRVTQIAFAITAVLLGLPPEQLARIVGLAMTEWLQWPPILVPFVALVTALLLWEGLAYWQHRLAMRRQSAIANIGLRGAFEYLRTEAQIAYEYRDYRLWMRDIVARVQDDLADADGRLASWGRAQKFRGNYDDLGRSEKLRPSFWLEHELDLCSILSSNYPYPAHTNLSANKEGARFDVQVCREQLTSLYPRAAWIRRVIEKPTLEDKPTRIEIDGDNERLIWESLDGKSSATITRKRSTD